MQIIPLSEGTFTIDKTKIFIPFNFSEDELQTRPTGSLLVEVQPFLVITSKDILLLDTGLGFSVNNEMQIHSNLKAHSILPEQITKVLISHLHKDHAGGITKRNYLGNYNLSFPNAKYYIQEQELQFALDTGFPSYQSEEISILENNSHAIYLKESGIIDEYISFEKTGAHSPHHQVFQIKEKDEIIFFGADDAPQLQQMKNKFIAKYDFDGRKGMTLRQKWWEKGLQENWQFLFYHDANNATFRNKLL